MSASNIGFAGNDSPSFVFPTAIATKAGAGSAGSSGARPAVANKPSFLSGGGGSSSHLSMKRGTEDLDFFIGDEALAAGNGPGYGVNYPIRHGQIENWDHMERFWSNSIFKYLRVEPEDHYFLLTEPVRWIVLSSFPAHYTHGTHESRAADMESNIAIESSREP